MPGHVIAVLVSVTALGMWMWFDYRSSPRVTFRQWLNEPVRPVTVRRSAGSVSKPEPTARAEQLTRQILADAERQMEQAAKQGRDGWRAW